MEGGWCARPRFHARPGMEGHPGQPLGAPNASALPRVGTSSAERLTADDGLPTVRAREASPLDVPAGTLTARFPTFVTPARRRPHLFACALRIRRCARI